MAIASSLRAVLDDVTQAGHEIDIYLHEERTCEKNTTTLLDTQPELDFPPALESSRQKLANAALQLLQLTADPKEYLEELSANNQHLVCLRWIVNLGILQHIPDSGSISYANLATKANVPEHQLKSVVRMAAAHGFLCEAAPMTISHSRISALIAKDLSFFNWARWLTNYSVPSAYRFADATQKWGKTEKKNETAFNLAMDAEVPFFDFLKENAKMNSMFSSYMRNVASSEATSFKHMIAGFDWASLGSNAKVVDVGGSGGHGSRALASAFPGLKFIVQDLPDTITNAEISLASNSELHQDRVEFMSHDFFTPQPVTDADVYLLRMIIHDWPDDSAITILSHIRDALKKPGARIVIMDTILPQPGTIQLKQERQLRVRDLTMMQVFNAKEREFDTWKVLLEQVGLDIINIQQPEGSSMGVLEIGLPDRGIREGVNTIPTRNGNSESSPTSLPATSIDALIMNGVDGSWGHSGSATVNGDGPNFSTHPPNPSTRDEHSQDVLPILIMGAGIGGLCLAQHLHKHSIPFLVFERDPSDDHRPQGYRLKLETDAAIALRESLTPEAYNAFESSCAESKIGQTDYDPISGACVRSRSGGGLAGSGGLRASYTVDRAVFRRMLMIGIQDKVQFAHDFASYEICEDNIQPYVLVTFKDGTTAQGRFLVGADGTRSAIRKQLAPHHKYLDTNAICIYGKTNMTPELLARYPVKALRWMTACADKAPLIQSILIGESPLTLLSEPIRFSAESRTNTPVPLPEDYVYWVLIGRKELFADNSSNTNATNCQTRLNSDKAYDAESAKASAAQSLALTDEWHPSLRSLFELQDVSQASTMHVVSAPPKIPAWQSSACVTLLGDACHAMSPCGGVGANVALRDAAELGKLFVGAKPHHVGGAEMQSVSGCTVSAQHSMVQRIAEFEDGLRQRALAGIMRSYAGSKVMFDQKPFEELAVMQT